ncbi:sphingomyelin phosphodiesterase [Pisolithus marmoratus]|nr:sphingomyelin phosphodiesterase [Pisolithus marmoratus]
MMLASFRLAFLCFATIASVVAGEDVLTAYTAPGAFPTSVYKSYWNDPTGTSAQPQPVISDPATHSVFLEILTDPANFPKNDTVDPHPLPTPLQPTQLLQQAIGQIKSVASNPMLDTCAKCQSSFTIAKMLVLAAPEQGPLLAEAICVYLNFSSTCYNEYSELALGSVFTQVVALGDMGGYDGQLICARLLNLCPVPATVPLNMTAWFEKPKPNPLPPPKKPSGERLKVLHVSDIHIDPRYATGYEANCTTSLCCRENVWNAASPDHVVLPAPRYGSYLCDTPMSLMLAAMQAIPVLTETEGTGFNFSLFTGDLTAHDPDNQYSRAFVEQAQVVVYDLLKKYVGPAPVYATLGNHDTYVANVSSRLYEHVSSLWYHDGWLPTDSVEYAETHYAAYSVKRPDGLRIISLDTDILNYFSYVNATAPDPFGILSWITDELQDAEDAGERVWIIGHVISGWDGTQSQLNPTNLCSVDRYSPHVIANIFYGHNHEDQFTVFYANNATVMNQETALAVSWISPSLTPLTNLNSGFRMYEVDSATFEVLDAYTWISRVDEFPSLDNQTEIGPTYFLEYSAREAYGGNIPWGTNDPLNATWWHLVTEQMETNTTLGQTFRKYQSKSSVRAMPCNETCLTASICYMRSGSASLAYENCPRGYGST